MISAPGSLLAGISPAFPATTAIDRLRHLYRTSIIAKALLEAAATRTVRAWRETALSTARAEIHKAIGTPPDSSAVIEVFKKLHELGVVQYIKGRTNHQHRIKWLYWSPSVAAVAAERTSDFKAWGQSERSRARRQSRLARKRKAQTGETGTGSPPAAETAEVKKARLVNGSTAKAKNPQVVLDLGGGVAVTWNRPHNPTPAEADRFAKAVAGVVQSLAGVKA